MLIDKQDIFKKGVFLIANVAEPIFWRQYFALDQCVLWVMSD